MEQLVGVVRHCHRRQLGVLAAHCRCAVPFGVVASVVYETCQKISWVRPLLLVALGEEEEERHIVVVMAVAGHIEVPPW